MFERLTKRVALRAEQAAERYAGELAERLRAALPRGIQADATREGVLLSGRAIDRRFAWSRAALADREHKMIPFDGGGRGAVSGSDGGAAKSGGACRL